MSENLKKSGGFVGRKIRYTPRDIRYTRSKDDKTLYAIVLGWPESGEVVIESLGTRLALYPDAIKQVEWLGSGEPVQWSRDVDGLKAKTPSDRPCQHACTLKIALNR